MFTGSSPASQSGTRRSQFAAGTAEVYILLAYQNNLAKYNLSKHLVYPTNFQASWKEAGFCRCFLTVNMERKSTYDNALLQNYEPQQWLSKSLLWTFRGSFYFYSQWTRYLYSQIKQYVSLSVGEKLIKLTKTPFLILPQIVYLTMQPSVNIDFNLLNIAIFEENILI